MKDKLVCFASQYQQSEGRMAVVLCIDPAAHPKPNYYKLMLQSQVVKP